jgi:Flp pilus assembly protein TadG
LWLILTLPVLMLLLILVIEIGNIWLARVELENAMEAAALAAAKEWGDSDGVANLLARNTGVMYAAANTVTGTPVTITANLGVIGPNLNGVPDGNLIFGAITNKTIPWVFCGNIVPSCASGPVEFGVRAQATAPVNSVVAGWGRYTLPTFSVSANATARYSCLTRRAELIRVRPENYFFVWP